MTRIRRWLACLTAALMLFSAVPAANADEPAGAPATETQTQALADDGTASDANTLAADTADAAPAYIRIKNKWQSNFLYESSDGIVRYGMTAAEDTSAQWTLEDAQDGTERIRNRKTGHYITLDGVSQRRDALTAKAIDESAASDRWYVEPSSRTGYSLIKSATAESSANLVIHEEDQLGYAEVSADINVTFESPQWALEPVTGEQPVRIVNRYRAGQALYETDALPDGHDRTNPLVAYGQVDPKDPKAQWILEPSGSDGAVKLRNRATGHYIVQFDGDNFWREIEAAPNADDNDPAKLEWRLADAKDESGGAVPGFVTITSAVDDSYVLNTQFEDIYARSNSWSVPGRDNAQWQLVPAFDSSPVRIAGFADGDAAPDYLYDDNGVVRHGALGADADAAAYQWIVEDYDGSKRIRNVRTGHYVTAGDPALAASGAAEGSRDDQWSFAESERYDDYVSIRSEGDAASYLNMAGDDGAARATEVAADAPEAQWRLEDGSVEPEFIRIQNVWQSFVLYEDENGDVKYGNERKDQRDQWKIVKTDGRKRFQNRATGHYLALPGMDGHLNAVDEAEATSETTWSVKTLNGGVKLIRSVTDLQPQGELMRLINLQNLTKYAELSLINPMWGSPQWRFVGVSEGGPSTVRFVGADGKALYESVPDGATDGVIKFGEVPESDRSSQWLLEDAGGGAYKIKNIATGHRVSMQNVADASHETQDDPPEPLEARAVTYDVWGSIKWFVDETPEDGFSALRSAWTGHLVRADGDGARVSRTAKDGDGNPIADARFRVVPIVVTPEAPAEPVMLKNVANGQSLYEQNGIVKYGDVDESNGYAHWLVDSASGMTRVTNRVTGHALAVSSDYSYILASASGENDAAAEWSLEATADGNHWMLRSLAPKFNDEYLNVQNGFGYAERGLYLLSYGSLQWDMPAAPDAYETPTMGEARYETTATPVQSDTNYVRIAAPQADGTNGASLYLIERDSGIFLEADEDGDDPASQWLAQSFNGRMLLSNRATGHLLASVSGGDGSLGVLDAEDRTDVAAQWTIGDSLGYKTIRSAASDAGPALVRDGSEARLDDASSAQDALWAFLPVVSDVKYEAEDAFLGGGAKTANAIPGYAGSGYADGLQASGAKVSFAVNAQAAGDYAAKLRYLLPSGSTASFQLVVNGLTAETLRLPGAGGWTDAALTLDLRAGINSVALIAAEGGASAAAIDSLTVEDSVAKAYRGATVPYITYEAEDGTTNGTKIGPSRAYLDPASEASGRQAVRLSETGQYVEFKTAEAANSIVLRYSIPDSEDGTGRQATLGLYVNGEFRQKLSLDSKYAWEYGSYPWSNDPKQGSPHRFFDEMHAMIGDVPAGATIRLEKDADSAASDYLIDLADLERVADPLAMPDGFVSVTDYGAMPDDGQDDTAAFKDAMAAAKQQNKGVWFPKGEFEFGDGLLDLSDVTIRGAGMWYTQLNGAKFMGRGGNVQVYDLLIDGGINVRDDEAITNAFHGAYGPGSVIQNVWIEHTKAGLWLTKPKDGEEVTDGLYMVGLRIRDLMADGINFCVGTSNSMMEQSDVRYPGDDGIAMWSAEGMASVNNTARFNTVSLPWLADNIVVFGGTDNKIQDNIAKDTIRGGAGIAVSTRFNPVPFAGTTVVERNTMIRTGSYSPDVSSNLGAIWVAAQEKDLTGTIVIRDNEALDSMYQGLSVLGTYGMSDVRVENLVVDGAGTYGVEAASAVRGRVAVDNVIVRRARMADVANGAGAAFVFDETNEGFANRVKPFSLTASDGATGRFAVMQGGGLALRVKDAAGTDVTEQTAFAVADAAIASVTAPGALTGLAAGETRVQATYGGETRVYTLTVAANAGGGSGTGGGNGSGNGNSNGSGNGSDDGNGGGSAIAASANAAENDGKLMESANEGFIAFETASDGNGTVPFTAEGFGKAAVANPNATLVVRSGDASYFFPLSLAAKLLGERKLANPGQAQWVFTVRPAEEAAARQAGDAAAKLGMELRGTPVEFGILLKDGERVEAIDSFGGVYVTRTIAVDGELDGRVSTALVFDPATEQFSYVPATFSSSGGKTTVTIKSMGNSLYAVASHPKTFSDVAGHWAQDEIGMLAARTIATGSPDGSFAPNRTITRAEFAALLVRALGLRAPAGDDGGSGGTFADVPATAWYAEEVGLAARFGLAQGMSDGTFRPDDLVTREQMAVMAAAAYRLAKGDAAATTAMESEATGPADSAPAPSFVDAESIHGWAADAVSLVASLGLMRGEPSGAFAPADDATRAEAVVLIARLLRAAQLMD